MIDHSLVTGFTMFIRRSFDMTCFGISTYHRHEPPLTAATTGSSVTTAPTNAAMTFDEASMAALRAIAASNTTAAAKKEPIVLGHSKVKDGGTLRRRSFSRRATWPFSRSTRHS